MTDDELRTLLREVYDGDINQESESRLLGLCRERHILPKDLVDDEGYLIDDEFHLPDDSPENRQRHLRLSTIIEELESQGLYHKVYAELDGTGYEFGELEGTRRTLSPKLVDAVVQAGEESLRKKRRRRR